MVSGLLLVWFSMTVKEKKEKIEPILAYVLETVEVMPAALFKGRCAKIQCIHELL